MLGFVRMLGATVYPKFLKHCLGELVFRKHALDRMGDDEFRALFPKIGNGPVFFPAHVSAVEHVFLLLFLCAGQLDFVGVGHDDVVARVNVGRVNRLVPTAQGVGDGYGQPAEYLIGSIDDLPIVRGGFRFG